MTITPPKQQESWEKQFKKLRNRYGSQCAYDSDPFYGEDTNYGDKDFTEDISDLISTERTRLLAEIKEVVWGMGFKDPVQAGQFRLHADGYNQALEDVLSVIEKLQEQK